jgi:hypothetical protein
MYLKIWRGREGERRIRGREDMKGGRNVLVPRTGNREIIGSGG